MTLRRLSFFYSFAVLFCVAWMASCKGGSSTPAAAVPENSFPVRGKVVSTDATHVLLNHEAVPGFMEAMTMAYKVKDPSVIGELHPGDRITATIVVKKDEAGFRDPHLDNIVVIEQAKPDYKPMVQYHVPAAGDAVPDFRLLNQSDRMIHLNQFKGKVVLLTFIYTRCQLSDFCPRMSHNFAEVDKVLAANPKLCGATHLISVSFDPAYDTPKVLRSYGGAYTGRYKQETFSHWDFAAPPEKELAAMTQFFNVGVTPGDNRSLNHSLSTVLIGKDGKLLAWYPTNDWLPADVVVQMKQAANIVDNPHAI
jgi:protein SCO1/2